MAGRAKGRGLPGGFQCAIGFLPLTAGGGFFWAGKGGNRPGWAGLAAGASPAGGDEGCSRVRGA
jgi:hypothetical protein